MKRNEIMKKAVVFALAVILCTAVIAVFAGYGRQYSESGFALDTAITITAYGKNAKKAVREAFEETERIDRIMNAYSAESEIYAINSAPCGTCVKVSDEVFNLIKRSKEIFDKTDGAFDITVKPLADLWNIKSENPVVPEKSSITNTLDSVGCKGIFLDEKNKTVMLEKEGMGIDLGGIAKGYAADRVSEILRDNNLKKALVDLGGNIVALGRKSFFEKWKIGIQTPFADRGEYFEIAEAENVSVVTSGSYERYFEKDGKIYHHILNPSTGYPAQSGVKSVTVICKNSADADALSTALYVTGAQRAAEFAEKFDAEIIILTDKDKILRY